MQILKYFWDVIPDHDPMLWSLFEVVYAFLTIRPEQMTGWVQSILHRCTDIINKRVERLISAEYKEKTVV